jgi:hypothetical protein
LNKKIDNPIYPNTTKWFYLWGSLFTAP